MKRLILYVKPYWIPIIIAAAASIGTSVANVWVIDILRQMVDSSIQKNVGVVPLLMIKAILVLAVGMASNYFMTAMTGIFGASVLKDLRKDAVERLMKVSPDFMEKNNFGDMVSRLSDDMGTLAGYMQTYFKDCIYVPVFVIGFVFYLVQMHPLPAFLCMVPLLVLVPMSIHLLKPVKLSQSEYVKMLGRTNNNIQEVFEGAEVVKAYGLQKVLSLKYYQDLKKTFDISNQNDLRQYNILPISVMVREFPVALALCISGYMVLKGQMTLGSMVAFLSAVKKLIEPLENLYQLVVRSQLAMVSVDRVFYCIDLPEEQTKGKLAAVEKMDKTAFSFKNVTFTYENYHCDSNNEAILKAFNLDIPKGKKIALVGRSGSGKSTVLKLLCRQYEVDSGEILYFHNKYSEMSPTVIRNEIAFIPQEPVIFSMSVKDNLRIGNPKASQEEIVNAAKLAGCHEFISAMPQGYETITGERGNTLSGGQRQRIAIARAILKNAPIWLLDEPTSALDQETEKMIKNALEVAAKEKTVITVAHRLTTVTDYDEILVLEEGSIVERGTHQELLKKQGRYYEMFQKYTGGESA